jgi:hypothetical protein
MAEKSPVARLDPPASSSERPSSRQRFSFSRSRRRKPDRTRAHLAVSEIECRRGGLDFPSWLILDEYNRVSVDAAYDFETTRPIGTFGPAFVRKIASTIKQAAARRRLRGVARK